MTGFASSEEVAVGLADTGPYLLEDAMKEVGGDYKKGSDFEPYVVTDGLLVMGRNPASAARAAKVLPENMAQSKVA